MTIRVNERDKNPKPTMSSLLAVATGVIIMLLFCVTARAADVDYYVYGYMSSVFTCLEESIEEDTGEPCDTEVAIPAGTVEIWNADTKQLLGKGQGNLDGYYTVNYKTTNSPHTIYIRVLIQGGSKLLGEVHDISGNPIVVNNVLFPLSFKVKGNDVIRFTDKPTFKNQFMFTQVGKIFMHQIYDKEADPGFASKWGLTKTSDSAFGKTLDLYGLFGKNDNVYYYKLRYQSATDSGYINDPLYKYNYSILGSGEIKVTKVKMGPHNVITPLGPLSGVYMLDERMIGYSPYWTEMALRGKWNTSGKNGKYTIGVTAWKQNGQLLANISNNHYATLNLHLVNNPPTCKIHKILYHNKTKQLAAGSECDEVTLLNNNDIWFQITAVQTDGFVGKYQLTAFHGHNTFDGHIVDKSYWVTPADPECVVGVNNKIVNNNGVVTFQNCAYRFRLHIWPRITNGYDSHIYEREDNWYVCIKLK